MANKSLKDAAFLVKNKGSSIGRFRFVTSAGVVLSSSAAVDPVGVLGGRWYEWPDFKESDDTDELGFEQSYNESGKQNANIPGNRLRTFNAIMQGNYSKLELFDTTKSITNTVKTANLCTITVAAHGYIVGQSVQTLAVTTPDDYNGIHPIVAVTTNTYSYYKIGADVGTAANTGTAQYAARINCEAIIMSAERGFFIESIYYSPTKDQVISTDAAYDKYCYHLCQIDPKWKNTRKSEGIKELNIKIIPQLLTTAPDVPPLGQLGVVFPVTGILALASETGNLQAVATT